MRPRLWMAFVLIFTMVAQVSAQSELRKAEKLLKLKAFDLAIKNYKSALAKHPDNASGHAQLGEAYLMTNQLLDALKSYEKAFSLEGNVESKYKLQYATALKKVGLYDLAESVFFEYASVDKDVAHHMLASTEYAKSLLQQPDKYDIVSFGQNSKSADFGVTFYKDQVVFCSFREDLKRENDKKNQSYIQKKGNQLFTVAQAGGGNPDFLRPDYKEIYNIGPLSYSKDGGLVAFMRNTFTTGSNQIFSDESNMSIYVAFTTEDGDFTDEKPFPYNQIEYSYAFPNLGFDGSALYFSSNRPGGLGGFDLYVSYFQEGKWSKPENLGPEVNTAGNEITPFFDGDQLYFASDFHFGLGGYDNFSATVNNGVWSQPQNLGKGINSPSDDYYLSPDLEGNTLYFSSNRLGGRGSDDIYIAYPLQQEEERPLAIIEEYNVPKAVNLDDLAREVQSDITPITDVNNTSQTLTDPSIVAVSTGESVAIISEGTLDDFSGAKLTAITTPSLPDVGPVDEWAEVFFIQLASLARSEGKIERYESLSALGRLYRFFKSSSVKIRLGTFSTRSHAEDVLRDVHRHGYRDAFITRDILASSSYELLGSDPNGSDANDWVNDYNPSSSYKVKLASYTDPLKFQVDKVLDLGRLEQWTKGEWTIFIIGGFETIDDAKRARIKALNRGFVDAELVEDNEGILSRVSEN